MHERPEYGPRHHTATCRSVTQGNEHVMHAHKVKAGINPTWQAHGESPGVPLTGPPSI